MTIVPQLKTVPVGYVPGTSTAFTSLAGLAQFLKNELLKLGVSTTNTALMTPQPAIKAPPLLADGMVRLARSPWRPVSGQSADEWVYYDATSSSWKAL